MEYLNQQEHCDRASDGSVPLNPYKKIKEGTTFSISYDVTIHRPSGRSHPSNTTAFGLSIQRKMRSHLNEKKKRKKKT